MGAFDLKPFICVADVVGGKGRDDGLVTLHVSDEPRVSKNETASTPLLGLLKAFVNAGYRLGEFNLILGVLPGGGVHDNKLGLAVDRQYGRATGFLEVSDKPGRVPFELGQRLDVFR